MNKNRSLLPADELFSVLKRRRQCELPMTTDFDAPLRTQTIITDKVYLWNMMQATPRTSQRCDGPVNEGARTRLGIVTSSAWRRTGRQAFHSIGRQDAWMLLHRRDPFLRLMKTRAAQSWHLRRRAPASHTHVPWCVHVLQEALVWQMGRSGLSLSLSLSLLFYTEILWSQELGALFFFSSPSVPWSILTWHYDSACMARYEFLQNRHLFWPVVLRDMYFWCKA